MVSRLNLVGSQSKFCLSDWSTSKNLQNINIFLAGRDSPCVDDCSHCLSPLIERSITPLQQVCLALSSRVDFENYLKSTGIWANQLENGSGLFVGPGGRLKAVGDLLRKIIATH